MATSRRLIAKDLKDSMVVFRDLLKSHQQVINRLNVYPVPDGDTGTNMALTLDAVVRELEAGETRGGGEEDLAEVCKAISHGSLMGARGNSGVILSQLLRGIAESCGAYGDGVDGPGFAGALEVASDLAHDAVVRPVEGTILTVARAASQGAALGLKVGAEGGEHPGSLDQVLISAKRCAKDALAATPSMLEALARAGVVDAGGTGYLLFFDALLHVVCKQALPEPPPITSVVAKPAGDVDFTEHHVGELRYEVMYLLHAKDATIPAFKEVWAGIGDSIVVVGGEGLWNCHIHTDDVGAAIEASLDAGRPRDIRVTDLKEQVEEEWWVREGVGAPVETSEGPLVTTSVVAVVSGDGIGRIFRSLGVHQQVRGGQSMNPSTSEILAAVEGVGSTQVIVLPNNKNIRPVAEQVDSLSKKSVYVVPTESTVAGFAALLAYDPAANGEENFRNMEESASRVLAAEVTQAVRDAQTEAGVVRTGEWMGLSKKGVIAISGSPIGAALSLLDRIVAETHELVTLIEGEGATDRDVRLITEWLHDGFPQIAVEIHHGGQPLYPFLFGIE